MVQQQCLVFDDGPSGPTISLYTMGKVPVGCGGAELQIVSTYIEGRARLLQSREGGPSRLLALLTRQIKHYYEEFVFLERERLLYMLTELVFKS